jgi:DNA repair protein RadC
MKIKELYRDERPRERLLKNGAESLSNVELLAIMLRTGTRKMNALELARTLLGDSEGRIGGIAAMSIDKLKLLPGIGPAKAATLAAAFELGRRAAVEQGFRSRAAMSSPQAVFRLMYPLVKSIEHEECWALLLNKSNRLISKELLSRGGHDSTIIDNRMVIRKALEKKATGVILVHNHPSGVPTPSAEDIRQTQALTKALRTCDLHLLDHVVIGDNAYYSFADEEMVDFSKSVLK